MNNSRLLKWFCGVVGVIVALAVVVAVLEVQMNKVPTLRIPRPVMPYPNAYDFYVRAGALIRDKEKIGFAVSEDPHPRQTPGSPPSLDRAYSSAEKEALVTANANTLTILRDGFSYQYLNPPARSFNTPFPHFARDRDMARLLVLESQVRAVHDDWGGAMDSGLDAIRMGQDMPRGGPFIAALVGAATQTIGRQRAWKIVENLDARESRSMALRMEDILTRSVPFADTMQEEKWSSQAGLIEMFGQRGWPSMLLPRSSAVSAYPNVSDLVQRLKSLTWSKGRSLRLFSLYMDQYIKNCRLPYAAMPKASPKVPNEPICQIMCPVFERGRIVVIGAETQNVLLTIKLTLRAYRLEHGQYPSTLSELSGLYLKRIPNDPFALKGPPRYKRLGDKYLLYSVGPDSKDNGGKAIFDKSLVVPNPVTQNQKQAPYGVMPESKGDIVAGVNTL